MMSSGFPVNLKRSAAGSTVKQSLDHAAVSSSNSLAGLSSAKSASPKATRCKFWPDCKRGDKCMFFHPIAPCKAFPSCKLGNECLFVHPKCKFGEYCAKALCPYAHSAATKRINAAPPPALSKPAGPSPSGAIVASNYDEYLAKWPRMREQFQGLPPPFVSTPTQVAAFPVAPAGAQPASKMPPVTTVYVGNINENAPPDLPRQLLEKCGRVIALRRSKDPSNYRKLCSFGYCDFELPEATLRAIRVLNDFPLGAKKLIVRVDDKTKRAILEYLNQKYHRNGRVPFSLDGDLPAPDAKMGTEDRLLLREMGEMVIPFATELWREDSTPTSLSVARIDNSLVPMEPSPSILPNSIEGRQMLSKQPLESHKQAFVVHEISQFRKSAAETLRSSARAGDTGSVNLYGDVALGGLKTSPLLANLTAKERRDYKKEAIAFFENKLLKFGPVLQITSLLGHRSQAAPEIRLASGRHLKDFTAFLASCTEKFEVDGDLVRLKTMPGPTAPNAEPHSSVHHHHHGQRRSRSRSPRRASPRRSRGKSPARSSSNQRSRSRSRDDQRRWPPRDEQRLRRKGILDGSRRAASPGSTRVSSGFSDRLAAASALESLIGRFPSTSGGGVAATSQARGSTGSSPLKAAHPRQSNDIASALLQGFGVTQSGQRDPDSTIEPNCSGRRPLLPQPSGVAPVNSDSSSATLGRNHGGLDGSAVAPSAGLPEKQPVKSMEDLLLNLLVEQRERKKRQAELIQMLKACLEEGRVPAAVAVATPQVYDYGHSKRDEAVARETGHVTTFPSNSRQGNNASFDSFTDFRGGNLPPETFRFEKRDAMTAMAGQVTTLLSNSRQGNASFEGFTEFRGTAGLGSYGFQTAARGDHVMTSSNHVTSSPSNSHRQLNDGRNSGAAADPSGYYFEGKEQQSWLRTKDPWNHKFTGRAETQEEDDECVCLN